jgi:hypothetical protein
MWLAEGHPTRLPLFSLHAQGVNATNKVNFCLVIHDPHALVSPHPSKKWKVRHNGDTINSSIDHLQSAIRSALKSRQPVRHQFVTRIGPSGAARLSA